MLNCPFCSCDLTKYSLNQGRCPSCGGILRWDEDSEADAPPRGEPGGQAEQAPSPLVLEDEKPSLRQILATIVGRGMQAYEPAEPNGPQSPDEQPAPQQSPAIAGAPAVPDPPASAAPPTTTPDGPPPDPIVGTIDARQLSPKEWNSVAKLWKDAIDPNVTPRMTLKADVGITAVGTKLVIPSRHVATPEDRGLESADYHMLKIIGEGGVGVVYSARQASVNRNVAVKMLHAEFKDDPDHRAKFVSEAVVTGDLDHPNIVPIHDLGSDDNGALFYSMKRVKGTPWSAVIGDSSLTENLSTLLSVADAIAFAHSRGIIHRDLKPENVMLGKFGEVLVMDWGIALSTPMFVKSDSISQSNSMGGTPAYMAPEMATGPIEAIGPASDVYLLGGILFEMVTGNPPHTGSDVMDCVRSAARNEIQPTDKTGELLDIAYRALATDTAERYASVQEFQDAIRQYQAHSESIILSERAEKNLAQAASTRDYQDYSRALFAYQEAYGIWEGNHTAREGINRAQLEYAQCAYGKGDYDLGVSLLNSSRTDHARLIGDLQRAQRERETRQRRLKTARRAVAALAVLVFLVIAGALASTYVQMRETELAKERAVGNQAKAEKASLQASKQTRKAKSASKKEAQQAEIARGERDRADKQRKAAVKAEREAIQAKRKTEAASYIAQIGLVSERIANNAFLGADNLLDEYDQLRESEEASAIQSVRAVAPPDGNASERHFPVSFLQQSSEEEEETTTPLLSQYRHWEWGHLRFLCEQAIQTLGGETLQRVESVAISQDGKWLVAGDSDRTVHVYARAEHNGGNGEGFDGQPLLLLHGVPVRAVAVTGDGRYIAAGGTDGSIQIWMRRNDGTGYDQVAATLEEHAAAVTSLQFSRDEKQDWLLSSSADWTVRLQRWGRKEDDPANEDEPPNEDELAYEGMPAFDKHFDAVNCAAFSPDGTRVVTASGDGTVRVWWPHDSSKKVKRFEAHNGPVLAVVFLADGRIASAGRDERILVWDPERLEEFDFDELQTWLERDSADPEAEDTGPPTKKEPPVAEYKGHTAEIRSLAYSSHFGDKDGNFLVSGSHDNTVKVWDLDAKEESEACLKTFRGHGGWVRSAAFAPKRKLVVSGGDDKQTLVVSGGYDKQIKVWDPDAYREVRVLRDDKREIMAAALQSDGSRVLTAGRDGVAVLWNAEQGNVVVELDDDSRSDVEPNGDDADEPQKAAYEEFEEGHDFLATAAAFVPKSDSVPIDRLLTSAGDGTVRLWNRITGSQMHTFEKTGYIGVLALSDNGRWFLTGGDNHTARLWDAEALNKDSDDSKVLQGHSQVITALGISGADALPNLRIVTGDASGRCKLWKCDPTGTNWSAYATLDAHLEGWITAVHFLPDNRTVLTASEEDTVKFWDVETGRQFPERTLPHHDGIRAMSVSRDGLYAVTVSLDRKYTDELRRSTSEAGQDNTGGQQPTAYRLSRWDLLNAKELDTCQFSKKSESVHSIAFYKGDSSALFTVRESGGRSTVYRWEKFSKSEPEKLWPDKRRRSAWAVVPSPDDSHVLTLGGSHAQLWNAETGEPEQVYSPHAPLTSVAFSPSGKRAATADQRGSVKIWNTPQGMEASDNAKVHLRIPQTHGQDADGNGHAVNSAVFAPTAADGAERLLTAGNDGKAKLWDISGERAELKFTFGGHTTEVMCAVFSPDGRYVAAGASDGSIRRYKVPQEGFGEAVVDRAVPIPGELIGGEQLHIVSVRCLAFSADGKRLLSGSDDNRIKIWDMDDVQAIWRVPELVGHTASVTSVAFSPDGRRVLSGSEDGQAKLWDVQGEKEVLPPDGPAVSDGSQDGQTKPWDPYRGKEVLSLKRHADGVTAVAFSADGSQILTASTDGRALLWRAAPISPTIVFPSESLEYVSLGEPKEIDPRAQLFDPDSQDFNGSRLRVTLAEVKEEDEAELTVEMPLAEVNAMDGAEQEAGNPVLGLGGSLVSLVEDGRVQCRYQRDAEPIDIGGHERQGDGFVIELNENASRKAVESVLRSITFHLKSADTATYTVTCELTNTVQSACSNRAKVKISASAPDEQEEESAPTLDTLATD